MKIDDKQEIGIGGFTVLARVRNVITKTADAPDVPLEDGSIANDHVIINPVILEIEGRVSDIFIRPDVQATIFRRGLSEIGNITKYIPAQTQTQISKIVDIATDVNNVFKGISAVINDGVQLADFVGDKSPGGQSNQEKFIETLETYYNGSNLMRIEMPDTIYENMILTSRVIIYDNQKGTAIDFKLTAKQLRFADVIFTDVSEFFKSPAPGGVSNQTAGQESNGLNDAPEVETSFAATVASWLGIFQ